MTKEEFLRQDPEEVESFVRSNDLHPSISGEKLRQLGERITEQVTAISHHSPNRPAVATPGAHCSYCPRALGCAALTHSVYRMWEMTQSRVYSEPAPEQLADEKDMLDEFAKVLKTRRDAVTAEIEGLLDRGKTVPGFIREKTYGKRAFKIDANAIRALTGVDPTEEKLCTPAELERRGVPATIVNRLTHNPYTGMKLTRVDITNAMEPPKKGSSNVQ